MRIFSVAMLLTGATIAASAQAGSSTSGPKDFTITIPLHVRGIPPNVTQLGISCYVMPADVSNMTNEIGYGAATVVVHPATSPPPGGSTQASVTIAFNALPGKDPSLARFYSCTAQFSGTERGAPATYFANGATTPPVFPLSPGQPFYLGSTTWTPIPGTSSH
jgi:hypothetical protein